MFKVFFLVVVCFTVADARRLNRFFWDDDSIVQHFNNDLDLTKREIRLCEPKWSGNDYPTYLQAKDGSYITLQDNLREVEECIPQIPPEMKSKITCKPIEKDSNQNKKVIIGCKALRIGK